MADGERLFAFLDDVEEALSILELGLHRLERWVLAEGKESRHQGIPLLSSLSLQNGVHCAFLVFPTPSLAFGVNK